MNPVVARFAKAVRARYPVSRREVAIRERPDLAGSFNDFDAEYRELEERYGFLYPQIVRDLHSVTTETLVHFNTVYYRHLTLPEFANFSLKWFRDSKLNYGSEFDYFCDRKIPLFDGDGDCDLLDLARYNRERDDCPVILFNHEAPHHQVTMFPSVERYLELLSVELESGDEHDWENESQEAFHERMKSRGAEDLLFDYWGN